jgi:hypothetical protein
MTSAVLASLKKISRSASDLRSRAIERLLRFMLRKPKLSAPFILKPIARRVWSPPWGARP